MPLAVAPVAVLLAGVGSHPRHPVPVVVIQNIMRPPVRPVDALPPYLLFLVKTVLSIVMNASKLNVPRVTRTAITAMVAIVMAIVAMAAIIMAIAEVAMAVDAVIVAEVAATVTAVITATIAGKPSYPCGPPISPPS